MVLQGSPDIQRTIIVNDESTETTGQLDADSFAVDGNGRAITTAISGYGPPISEFAPAFGSLYIDRDTDKVYVLTQGTSAAPNWEQFVTVTPGLTGFINTNWALNDLTFDENRIHDMDGNTLTIQTDGSNNIHTIDAANYVFSFGDLSGVANQSTLILDDSTHNITIGGANGTVLSVDTSSSAITVNEEYTLPITDGTSGQVIVTDGDGILSFSDVLPITHYASAIDSVSTSSFSNVVVPDMTLTPDAGTYHVLFNAEIFHGSNNRVAVFSIYANGFQIVESEITTFLADKNESRGITITAKVSGLLDAQVIDIRFHTNGGSLTVAERTLTLIKVA